MRISLAQISNKIAVVGDNVATHIDWINKAKKEKSSLVIFPELSLSGYDVRDAVINAKVTNVDHNCIAGARNKEIMAIYGGIEQDNYTFYNTIWCNRGYKNLINYRKCYLPNYGMFEEARYMASGDRLVRHLNYNPQIGMIICEDAWHPSTIWLHALAGTSILVICAASPYRQEAVDHWKKILSTYATVYAMYVVFVNRVGTEEGLSFWGGSCVYDPFGVEIASAELFTEELLTVDLNLAKITRARLVTNTVRDERTYLVQRELQRIVDKNI